MNSTDTRNIPLDRVDDPRIAMRGDIKDERIDELMADLKAVGLIQAIVVRPVGDRYEIIAGHRRTTAARLLGWATIKAEIVNVGDDQAFQMRTIENLSRADVDPVDEACYIAEIMNRTGKTIADMAIITHRSEKWVEDRLAVFNMPDYLQEALKHKKIPLGAALELAQIENERVRREYTLHASLNGVSVSTARRWRETVNSQQTWSPEAAAQVLDNPANYQEEKKVVTCARCGGPCYLHLANSVWVHPNDCNPDAKLGVE